MEAAEAEISVIDITDDDESAGRPSTSGLDKLLEEMTRSLEALAEDEEKEKEVPRKKSKLDVEVNSL